MLKLGEKTKWGEVAAIGCLSGERYYWFVSPTTGRLAEVVAMMPASTVEPNGIALITITPGCAISEGWSAVELDAYHD